MFARQLLGGRGLWLVLVLAVVGAVVAGCASFFNKELSPPSTTNSSKLKSDVSISTSPAPKDEVAPCSTSVMEPERSPLVDQALADPKFQALRANLEGRGLEMNSVLAIAVHEPNTDKVFVPFGQEAHILWTRNQDKTTAFAFIQQGNKTLNIAATGEEFITKLVKGDKVSKLLKSLQTKSKFKQFEKTLKQKGKKIVEDQIQLLLDETNGHATLALATENNAQGRFSHLTKLHLKKGTDNELEDGEDPTVFDTACTTTIAQNEDSQTISIKQAQVVPAMEHFLGGGGGGYQDPSTLCTSTWGYQYQCYSFTPTLSVSATGVQHITFPTQSVQAQIIAWNSGGGILNGGSAVTTGAPFSIVSGSTFSLQPGQPQTIVVRFNPTTSGYFTGNVRVSSGSQIKDVQQVGWTLTVTPSRLDFNTLVNSPQDLQFSVKNDGPEVDTGTSVTVTIPHSSGQCQS